MGAGVTTDQGNEFFVVFRLADELLQSGIVYEPGLAVVAGYIGVND
jgi:hypothetical protein